MRYASTQAKWPPLQVWVLFAVLGAILAGGLAWWVQEQTPAQAPARELFQKRLEDLRQRWQNDPQAFKVVVLGNSLVREGIETTNFFRTAHVNPGARPIEVYKVWVNGARLESFLDPFPVFPTLDSLAPDLLAIEESLLATRHEREKPELTARLMQFSAALRSKLLPEVFSSQTYRGPATFDHFSAMHDDRVADTLSLRIKPRVVRPYLEDTAIHRIIIRLQSGGTQVIQLHLPRPGPIDSLIHAGEQGQKLEMLQRWYEEEMNVPYWKFEDYLPFYYFRDHTHLNTRGSLRYSEWLRKKIEGYQQALWRPSKAE